MKTKFYEFNQNNTGGSFTTNDKLCHWMFIEAETESEAEKKAFGMGVYYDGSSEGIDCPCCGDRWYPPEEIVFPYRYGTFSLEDAEDISEKHGVKFKKTTFRFMGKGKPNPDEYDVIFSTPEEYIKYLVERYPMRSMKSEIQGRVFYKDGKVFEA